MPPQQAVAKYFGLLQIGLTEANQLLMFAFFGIHSLVHKYVIFYCSLHFDATWSLEKSTILNVWQFVNVHATESHGVDLNVINHVNYSKPELLDARLWELLSRGEFE